MTRDVPPDFAEPLRAALAAPGGVEFIRWLLLDQCGILRSPMASAGSDLAYLCGRQDIGYALVDLIAKHQPSILIQLWEMKDDNA